MSKDKKIFLIWHPPCQRIRKIFSIWHPPCQKINKSFLLDAKKKTFLLACQRIKKIFLISHPSCLKIEKYIFYWSKNEVSMQRIKKMLRHEPKHNEAIVAGSTSENIRNFSNTWWTGANCLYRRNFLAQ